MKGVPKKISSSKNFTLKRFYSNSRSTRFGIVISSSVCKKAVHRNKIKRRVKGAILDYLKKSDEVFVVLIYVKKNILGFSYQEIKQELLTLFKKAKILKNV